MDSVAICYHVKGVTASEQTPMECIMEKDSQGERYFELQFGKYPTCLTVYLSTYGLWRLQRVLKDAEIKLKEDIKGVEKEQAKEEVKANG